MAVTPRLDGLRAVVTGGSRGLGRAVVDGLCARGASVATTARDVAALAPLVAEHGERVHPVALELADADSVDRAAADIVRTLGRVDLLVNNAGALGATGPLLDVDPDDVAHTVAANITGTLRLIRALRPAVPSGGAIVNVTSGAAARPGWAAYAVSKAALDAVTTVLRAELAPEGIRVIGVNPGGLRTQMRAAAYPDEDPATVPSPESIVPVFVAIAAGDDPGEYVEARTWTR